MRFRRRLIQPEPAPLDADGQLTLPDDLAALGQQLRREADQLARAYPASAVDRPTDSAVAERSSLLRRRRWYSVAAIAGAVLLSLTAYRSFRSPELRRETAADTHGAVPSGLLAPEERREVRSESAVRRDRASEDGTESQATQEPAAPAPTPAVLLWEASGPELEGLLDLWEQQGPGPSSVSI